VRRTAARAAFGTAERRLMRGESCVGHHKHPSTRPPTPTAAPTGRARPRSSPCSRSLRSASHGRRRSPRPGAALSSSRRCPWWRSCPDCGGRSFASPR
jgi:hypothetical protein